MKKIISCMALTILLFACRKNEFSPQINQGSVTPKNEKTGAASGPKVTTTAATYVLSFGATSGGTVSSSGGGANVTERGVCVNTSPNPTIAHTKFPSGSGSGTFTTILSGLAGGTTYYARAYATKSTGTTYGNQVSFTTASPNYGTVTDIDGNVYTTITIGSQVWTVENLKATRYRNGVSISHVTDDAAWATQTTGAYCNYNNDAGNVATYGRLYNWYAVADANNIAPAGWHVPTLAEWDILRNYLGGLNIAGGKAKEAGFVHWLSPNIGADNSSGFTALPAGGRFIVYPGYPNYPAAFYALSMEANWWTATGDLSAGRANFIAADYNSTNMYRSGYGPHLGYYEMRTGYGVRLVKD